MPAQPNLKSTAITNWDAKPPVRPTAGLGGGQSVLYDITDVVGPTTDGDTTGGILRCCRMPSNAVLKQLLITQEAATTTASFDIGIDYSDDPNDIAANQHFVSGTPLVAALFASGLDTHALPGTTAWLDVTFRNTSGYLPQDTILPLWHATNSTLTSDPGCMMDIVLTNKATISGAATMIVRAVFTIAAQ